MQRSALYILTIMLLFSCTHPPPDKFSPEEKTLMQKYPLVFAKYKDTTLVLNAFRYIKIDTSTYKHLRVLPHAIWETTYRIEDYDSILRKDYKISTISMENYNLYLKLFSINYGKHKQEDPGGRIFSDYIFEKLPACVNSIYNSLNLKPKLPPEALRKALQLSLERCLKSGVIKPSQLKHLDLYVFDMPSLDQRFFNITRNDSNIYFSDALIYFTKFRRLLITNTQDSNAIYPVKLYFDTGGKFQSIHLNKKISKEQMSRLHQKISETTNGFKIRLVNNKIVPYSVSLLRPRYNYRDTAGVKTPPSTGL